MTPGAIATLTRGQFGPNRGHPQIQRQTLPAPWTGGTATTVEIVVRLPANYDPAHKRYPTVYETPMTYEAWSSAVRPNSALDRLEQSGDVPPMIYVFAGAIGGPHVITQCIDSADGLQHWDTFMSTTLIAWVDGRYATIADPAARTLMGSSQGGYCAADLMLRHPDVWHQEISFDGFYDAPPRDAHTAGSGGSDVFGGDQALMDACSPITLAPQIPADTRQKLFAVLLGLPSQVFYGHQWDLFGGILDQNGYPRAMIESPYGHSWGTVDVYLARTIRLVAARMVQQGVFP